jgi:hypothetical protein
MKIKLNGIEFEVGAVPADLRAAMLADPAIAQAVGRDVYAWDHVAQTGKVLVQTTARGSVPLPNAMMFFVPRVGTAGKVVRNDAATTKMGRRFLETVKARNVTEVVKSLTNLVQQPQKLIPVKEFAPLNPTLSYVIKMHVELAVTQLRDASRNLGGYLFLPGQVSFRHEVTGGDAEAAPELPVPQPAFIVPTGAEANQAIRRIASARRLEELQAEIKAFPGGVEEAGPELRQTFARAVAEWKVLMQPITPSQPARRPVPQPGAQGSAARAAPPAVVPVPKVTP